MSRRKTFGEQLKALRTERSLTQAEFAKLIGIGRVTLARWETNKQVPEFGFRRRLVELFGSDLVYALTR